MNEPAVVVFSVGVLPAGSASYHMYFEVHKLRIVCPPPFPISADKNVLPSLLKTAVMPYVHTHVPHTTHQHFTLKFKGRRLLSP